jgi:hypothetical protein
VEAAGTPWLFATVPGALAGAALLVVAIRGLVRALRVETLARLRVVAEQAFTLAAPGPVVLTVEGPLGTTKFASLEFTVVGPDGRTLPTHMIVFRRSSTTLGGTTQLALRRFETTAAGSYVLRVTGVDPGTDYGSCAILLTRPTGALLPLWIVGTVAGALLLLGGLVGSILLLPA